MTRRESRETAFALLFEWSFKEDTLDEVIETAKAARGVELDKFALSLAEKVVESRDEIDTLIEQYSQGWKISRISRTSLAVLRLSFCELTKFGDIPVGASINEAVELVKKFGTDEEAAYLNGILGNFERVRKGLKPAPPLPRKKVPAQSKDSIDQTNETSEQLIQSIEKDIQNLRIEHTHHSQDDVELMDDIVIEVE